MLFNGNTDVGKKRKENQDHFGIKEYSDSTVVVIVCDGMGGHRGGREASHGAVEAFLAEMDRFVSAHLDGGILNDEAFDIKNALCDAVKKANEHVIEIADSSDELREMGTTLVGAVVSGNRVYTANVGDSRLYHIKDGEITQITHDHSLVQYYVDIGRISQSEAKNSPHKNIITRSVGNSDFTDPDVFVTHIHESDEAEYLVLCSDGLYNMVEEGEIARIVSDGTADVAARTEMLIANANTAGGTDNITAVLIAL